MSREPGIKYPTLPNHVDKSVHEMGRNIFDNLFNLKKKVETLEGAKAAGQNPTTTPTAGDSTVQTLASGTYTPTINNVLNLSASQAFECQYLRVGKTVTVSGRVSIDPTAAGPTQLSITLPISSNFQKLEQCAGTAAAPSVAGQSASIQGDTGTNHALLQWVAVDTSSQNMLFTFTYTIV